MDNIKKTEPNLGKDKPDRKSPIPLSDRRRLAWKPKDKAAPVTVFTDWASI